MKKIVKLALEIPAEFKVVDRNGTKYGKWILREAFKNFLPTEVIWRSKYPIEAVKWIRRIIEKCENDVKIDRSAGRILSHKKSPKPYKNIPIARKSKESKK